MRSNGPFRGFSTFELIGGVSLVLGVFAVMQYVSHPGVEGAADCVVARWRASLSDAPSASKSCRSAPAERPGPGVEGRGDAPLDVWVPPAAIELVRDPTPAAPASAEQAIATALDELDLRRPRTLDERPRFLLDVEAALKQIGAELAEDPGAFLALSPEQRGQLALLDATYDRARAVHRAAPGRLPFRARPLFAAPAATILPALSERSARLPRAAGSPGAGTEPSVALFVAVVEAYQAAARSRDHRLLADLRPLSDVPLSVPLATPDYHALIVALASPDGFIDELASILPDAVLELIERLVPQLDDTECYPASADLDSARSFIDVRPFQECENALGVVVARAISALAAGGERAPGISSSRR